VCYHRCSRSKWENPCDHRYRFKIQPSIRFKNRIWLAVAISLFSSAASAQTYPVSGVWVATDDRFPLLLAGRCLILKHSVSMPS